MSPRHESGGFVLVGVIMFVLALTILGMSLFAISGYEASFMGQSRDENAALYRAQGGIDLALVYLEGGRLQDAHGAETYPGVDSAFATQPDGSGGFRINGPVSGDTMTLTVQASAYGVSRRLSARFLPHLQMSSYKRFLTVSDPGVNAVDVLTSWSGVPGPRNKSIVVFSPDSSAWTSWGNTSWENHLDWSVHPPIRTSPPVPLPEVSAFIAAHSAPPTVTLPYTGPLVTLDQHNGSGIDFYFTPTTPAGADWTVIDPGTITINVRGTAVWMLPRGIRSGTVLKVHSIDPSPATATLVIVGSPNPSRASEATLGIGMTGGLDVDDNVNLLLVTDGSVDLAQYNDYGTSNHAAHLSIYCRTVEFMGPLSSLATSYLGYDKARMNPVITALEAAGALPGTYTGSSSFTLAAGSWRDYTP